MDINGCPPAPNVGFDCHSNFHDADIVTQQYGYYQTTMKEIMEKINTAITLTGKRPTTMPVDTALYAKLINELGCDTTPESVTVCGVDVYNRDAAMRLS